MSQRNPVSVSVSWECLKSVRDPLGTYTTYRYDRLGNMTQMTNVLGDSTTYTYDDLNRLLRETDAQGHVTRYSYDAVGNRMSSTDPNGTVSSYEYYPNYLVKSVTLTNGKHGFAYNANGNLIAKGRHYSTNETSVTLYPEQGDYWEYEYDLMNRLTQVTRDGVIVAEYTYDGNGLRLKKEGSGKTTYYIFGLNGEVLYEQEH